MTELELAIRSIAANGAIIGSVDDAESPQPKDGDQVIVLERPTLPGEQLKNGQIGRVEIRPLLNHRGKPTVAAGCPWVHTASGAMVLAKRWVILGREESE